MNFYRATRRHISENCNFHSHHYDNLKSNKIRCFSQILPQIPSTRISQNLSNILWDRKTYEWMRTDATCLLSIYFMHFLHLCNCKYVYWKVYKFWLVPRLAIITWSFMLQRSWSWKHERMALLCSDTCPPLGKHFTAPLIFCAVAMCSLDASHGYI
jgi:hypothetical protein